MIDIDIDIDMLVIDWLLFSCISVYISCPDVPLSMHLNTPLLKVLKASKICGERGQRKISQFGVCDVAYSGRYSCVNVFQVIFMHLPLAPPNAIGLWYLNHVRGLEIMGLDLRCMVPYVVNR